MWSPYDWECYNPFVDVAMRVCSIESAQLDFPAGPIWLSPLIFPVSVVSHTHRRVLTLLVIWRLHVKFLPDRFLAVKTNIWVVYGQITP